MSINQVKIVVTAARVALLAFLASSLGCSALVKVDANPDVTLPSRGPSCEIELAGEFTEFPDACTELGVMTYQTPAAATRCDVAPPQSVAREKGCELGATHARVRWTRICFRFQAEFFACPVPEVPVREEPSPPEADEAI